MTGCKEYIIRLPWPPAVLSPNSRRHWAEYANAAKKYRAEAHLMAKGVGCKALNCTSLTVEITFCPPDRRKRDTDNMLASIKSGLDGIADATGVDDSRWHYGIARDGPVKGGAVLVHVFPGKEAA
jgi:crossover junction endodeoxyribonuclease RusA